MRALVGVGVGPGDPELVTTRALRVLRDADRVFAPTTAVDAAGRAESIVRQACPGLRLERLVFTMAAHGSEQRHDAFRAAARTLVSHLDVDERVAFVTLGDPNVYSTFTSLAAEVRALRPDVPVETVPGIMAFQDLAARTGTTLLEGTERLSLITALAGPDALDGVLDDPSHAVVVYKGGRYLEPIVTRLGDAGRLDGAVVGELLGLPGERVGAAAEAADAGPATYLATIIVPPAVRRSDG